jgi:dual specificity tyrosine-phosphorylation-regulated kinase 2/3/4
VALCDHWRACLYQALVEVKLLTQLRDKDPTDAANIIHLKVRAHTWRAVHQRCGNVVVLHALQESFYFRHHLCITFPLLSINLYEFIKSNNFQGVSLGLIRRFAIQVWSARPRARRTRARTRAYSVAHIVCVRV